MFTGQVKINSALISVANKDKILDLAKMLSLKEVSIIATGSTAEYLNANNIPTTKISNLTSFPEIMEGRVKTLHPLIHGGILGKRDIHKDEATIHNISWIDLVVCNFYPFEEITKGKKIEQLSNSEIDISIENIDIGGPTMVRAAAKNFSWVTCVVDPKDYDTIIDEYQKNNSISYNLRKKLAIKAFSYTAKYDSAIYNFFQEEKFPEQLTNNYKKIKTLRYGENPHQEAAIYVENKSKNKFNLLDVEQLNGKEMSYNNYMDVDAAFNCILDLHDKPSCVVIKHATPCGIATSEHIAESFVNAYLADQKSAFGGIIALNRTCSVPIVTKLKDFFVEIIIAPDYELDALKILKQKKNLRVLKSSLLNPKNEKLLNVNNNYVLKSDLCYRQINGGLLVQDNNLKNLTFNDLFVVTKIKPSQSVIQDLLFSWKVVKHVKSNAIVIAKNNTTLGIGGGQVSRVDAVTIALMKAKEYDYDLSNAVIASDGFFPFKDNIELLSKYGIKHIIQPGGSMRDEEVISACNEHNISMCFTKYRSFYH